MIALVFLPALVIGEKEKNAAAVNFQPICDFNANEIKRLKRNKEELKAMVQLETDLYKKLKNSSSICGTIGYLTLPDCAKKEGMKEGMNVFDKLDDKCAEDKTNRITMSLQKVLSLVTKPSGQEVFRSCKDIVVKNILEQFEKMQGLICSLCDKSTCVSSRRKRSYGGGYYPGGYDPSTIWFQYLLCHEQKISCYFFTQGWNEKDYGQYYLYENVFDTDLHSLGHASSSTDDHFLTFALLAGAGRSHQYPYQGYPSYKKRRHVIDEENVPEVTSGARRRRRHTEDEEKVTEVTSGDRRRRRNAKGEEEDRRRRRNTKGEDEERRRRRHTIREDEDKVPEVSSGDRRRRRRRRHTKGEGHTKGEDEVNEDEVNEDEVNEDEVDEVNEDEVNEDEVDEDEDAGEEVNEEEDRRRRGQIKGEDEEDRRRRLHTLNEINDMTLRMWTAPF